MQFSYTAQLSKERYQSWLLSLIKIATLIFCFIFIWRKISEEEIQFLALISVLKGIDKFSLTGLILIVLVVPVNWLIEAIKWEYLMRPFVKMSKKKALMSVFSGLAFGFVTPRSIGDYVGRVVLIDPKYRGKAIFPTIISRVSQLIPTLVIGFIGLYFLLPRVKEVWTVILWSGILFIAIGIMIILVSSRWNIFPEKIKVFMKTHYSFHDHMHVIALSFLRYFVFGTQFMAALYLMGADLPFVILFAGVSWIFLAKSILPSFNFLSDLGIREFSAILFFEAFKAPLEPVLVASIFIWTVNILFPTVLGVFIIGKSKFDLW